MTCCLAPCDGGGIASLSTKLYIFAVTADGGAGPVNRTDTHDATDTRPAVSPDGKWLAYAAMKRPGYESDRLVLMLRDIATGETKALTGNWDRSVASIAWEVDGKGIIVTADDVLDHPVFRVDAASGKEIGRASCRERGCRYVWISVVAVPLNKKRE